MDRNRILGGNPLGVILRLVVLSIIVGIVLSALEIHPTEIVYHARRLVRRVLDLGWPAIETAVGYFLLGAVIVVPIWIIARLLGALTRGRDDRR